MLATHCVIDGAVHVAYEQDNYLIQKTEDSLKIFKGKAKPGPKSGPSSELLVEQNHSEPVGLESCRATLCQ